MGSREKVNFLKPVFKAEENVQRFKQLGAKNENRWTCKADN